MIKDINETQPHKVSEVICINCKHRWLAVNDDYTFRDLYHHSINLHYLPIKEIKGGVVMKLVLCLFLIAIGIIGLYEEHKRRVKARKEIMKRVITNHIIARDALVKLSTTELMTAEEFLDAIEHLTDNSIEIILKACGTSYVAESDWLMKEYDKNKEVKI